MQMLCLVSSDLSCGYHYYRTHLSPIYHVVDITDVYPFPRYSQESRRLLSFLYGNEPLVPVLNSKRECCLTAFPIREIPAVVLPRFKTGIPVCGVDVDELSSMIQTGFLTRMTRRCLESLVIRDTNSIAQTA